jgi:hypothetical protein
MPNGHRRRGRAVVFGSGTHTLLDREARIPASTAAGYGGGVSDDLYRADFPRTVEQPGS